MALALLALGIGGIISVRQELKTGQALTLGVLFDTKTLVSEKNSPGDYWMNIAWQSLGFIFIIVLGIWNLLALVVCGKSKS